MSPTVNGPGPRVVFGAVFGNIADFAGLVHRLCESPDVAATEFSFQAPIYKAAPAIVAGLKEAKSALDKFDVYFRHTVLDEDKRVAYREKFASDYIRRVPGTERQDLFAASADILQFSFELVPPTSHPFAESALYAIQSTPHDPTVLAALRAGQGCAREHLRGDWKLFFDHMQNPRRHDLPQVKEVVMELGFVEPYVVELITDGAVPGYFWGVMSHHVAAASGRFVHLPG